MPGHVRLTVPSGEQSLPMVRAVAESFAESLGADALDCSRLAGAVCEAMAFVSAEAFPDHAVGELELSLEFAESSVEVQIHDRGRPLAAAGGELGELPAALDAIAHDATGVQVVNLGGAGKLTMFSWPLERVDDLPAAAEEPAADDGPRLPFDVRDATPADAQGISRLVYDHYALQYVHSDFYRPRWVAEQLDRGSLLSTVAVAGGHVIGHHALLTPTQGGCAESGVAVVHPAYRGLGIFGELMERTLARAEQVGLIAVYGGAVTFHPYSQRAEHAYGYRETALLLGSLPALAPSSPGDTRRRSAQLISYLMLQRKPRAVRLPEVYAERLRGTYANLSLPLLTSAPATDRAAEISSDRWSELGTGLLRISGWDQDSTYRLHLGVRELLADHVDVLFADLDLESNADVDEAVSRLNRYGFFYAGLRPSAELGHDVLRLQRLNSHDVELERIVVDSPFAHGLLASIREDRDRVERLTM